jgi:aminocarboxymuconate-semialdehyde decarboxylase
LIIDCHCHIVVAEMTTAAVPERWRLAVPESVVGEFTDVDVMLAHAARQGVDHLLLSPWIRLVPSASKDLGGARQVCAIQNEALSAHAAARPGRISGLGAVPIGDPEAAADELVKLMKLPGMRGAEIPARVGGRYLGDDVFEPFWAAAAAAGALIFVHPTTTGLGQDWPHYLWNSVGNPLETAITAAHLAVAGVLERHSDLKILLAHGGGGLHAVRGRLRRAFEVRSEARERSASGPDAALRAFYYDSLTHDAQLLADLIGHVGAGRVVLGSDRPFDMGTDDPVRDVRALGFGDAEAERILGGNASRLLGLP